jgi:ubiquitin-like protein Nedd8
MVEIRIRSLTGRNIPVEIDLKQKVADLKEVVEVKEGIPPQQQRFLFAGRQLDDDKSLEECGVVAGSDLHLVLSLRGG